MPRRKNCCRGKECGFTCIKRTYNCSKPGWGGPVGPAPGDVGPVGPLPDVGPLPGDMGPVLGPAPVHAPISFDNLFSGTGTSDDPFSFGDFFHPVTPPAPSPEVPAPPGTAPLAPTRPQGCAFDIDDGRYDGTTYDPIDLTEATHLPQIRLTISFFIIEGRGRNGRATRMTCSCLPEILDFVNKIWAQGNIWLTSRGCTRLKAIPRADKVGAYTYAGESSNIGVETLFKPGVSGSHIDVYIVPEIARGDILGFLRTFNKTSPSERNYIVLAETTPDGYRTLKNIGATLGHELGHFFGLDHFDEDSLMQEFSNDNDFPALLVPFEEMMQARDVAKRRRPFVSTRSVDPVVSETRQI